MNLQEHIKRLREQEASKPTANKNLVENSLLLLCATSDRPYLANIKSMVGSFKVHVKEVSGKVTKTEVQLICRQRNVTKVITTSIPFLHTLLAWDKKKAPSLDSYAGSLFRLPCYDGQGDIEIVFIQPLKQLVTVPYGKYIVGRYISKLTAPDKWYKASKFTGFSMIEADNFDNVLATLKACFLVAIDIETFKENAAIRCLAYTGFTIDSDTGDMKSQSFVLAIKSMYDITMMRKLNWDVKAPKVMQNGMYDISYFFRYSAPVYNYIYDTANMFHCWLVELPKDLGFLNAFLVREARYWKDLADTTDLHEYYKYNALDTWGTGNAFLAMIAEIPDYAFNNYLLEFPLVFASHMCEMRGIKRDMAALEAAKKEQENIIDEHTKSLNRILGIPAGESFNVQSPPQMKALLKILGCGDLPSGDEKNLKKARFRHPFNARIINSIIAVRKARKLVSTYLTEGKEFIFMNENTERFLFSIRPHGTDTSRQSSREHPFWCGANMQNIPRGKVVKQTFVADEGFAFCEVDLEQAESRDTAYISGDENLITNVEYSPDFHCSNASAFFGIPFEELYDAKENKVLNKPIRQLGKPVNHGANYNMGEYVLIDTMGEENIIKAKLLLKLPKAWGYKQVATHLLEQFHKAYPKIKKVYYRGVIEEVITTGLIASKAVHWDWQLSRNITEQDKRSMDSQWQSLQGKSWTRRVFSDPIKSKHALNSYIAHPPQSLNAQTLNKAFLSVFNDLSMSPKYSSNIKVMLQIHDSILFQYRIGHEYLIDMVRERMQIPVTIKAYDGQVRTFVVPAEAKYGSASERGYAKYWSETE